MGLAHCHSLVSDAATDRHEARGMLVRRKAQAVKLTEQDKHRMLEQDRDRVRDRQPAVEARAVEMKRSGRRRDRSRAATQRTTAAANGVDTQKPKREGDGRGGEEEWWWRRRRWWRWRMKRKERRESRSEVSIWRVVEAVARVTSTGGRRPTLVLYSLPDKRNPQSARGWMSIKPFTTTTNVNTAGWQCWTGC